MDTNAQHTQAMKQSSKKIDKWEHSKLIHNQVNYTMMKFGQINRKLEGLSYS